MQCNKITKRSDLYREWARVLDMSEEAGIDSCGCVKYKGEICIANPTFDSRMGNYTFAISILEGRPVFVGDTLYSKSTGKTVIIIDTNSPVPMLQFKFEDDEKTREGILLYELTWEKPKPKPKPTITINGKTFPAPKLTKHLPETSIYFGNTDFSWDNVQDKANVVYEIIKLLTPKAD